MERMGEWPFFFFLQGGVNKAKKNGVKKPETASGHHIVIEA